MLTEKAAGLENSGTDLQPRQVLFHLQTASSTEQYPTSQVCSNRVNKTDIVTLSPYHSAGNHYTIDTPSAGRYDDG